MHRRWIVTVFLAIVLSLLGTLPAYADNAEQDVLTLVNAQRSQHGLPPLVLSTVLTNAARSYAGSLASGNFFSHTGLDGSTFITRDEAAGYRGWDYLEENLGAGQTSAQQVVSAWMASPDHRSNILSPNVREIGVGHLYQSGSKYGNYWVQEFGDRPGTQLVSFRAPTDQRSASGSGSPPPNLTPVTAPASASNPSETTWDAPTGHRVGGEWLGFVRDHGNVDNFGLPLTDVISSPLNSTLQIQVFQRAVLEDRPGNPPGAQIGRLLLGDILYPGADAPISPDDAPPGPSDYFPFSPDRPTGLGHFVADYTRDGQPIYFKSYFDSHGGVAAFGYPKEEPKLRDGIWTQRFQAAVFQYHPENDRDGYVPGTNTPLRTYRVQLELLGDEYVKAKGLSTN